MSNKKIESMPRTPFSTHLSGSAKETELRLKNIFSGPKERPPVLFLALMCATALLCGNLVSCQIAEAEVPEGPAGVSLLEGTGVPVDPEALPASETEEDLLQALFQAASEQQAFQLPTARLLTSVGQDGGVLGAAFVTDHLENTLILGVMDTETKELTGPIYRYAMKNAVSNVTYFYDYDGDLCLLYTCNGQMMGQYRGEAGLVRFDGTDITWKWPVEGDIRAGSGAACQEYKDYWTSHLALMAAGGVDIYEADPAFEWGKEEPASMWQVGFDESFYSSRKDSLPMPIYFQSLDWLVGHTGDPGGWRITSLISAPDLADLEGQVDCFTLTACMDDGTGEFTADLFFPYDTEPSRPRIYAGLDRAEVRVRAAAAAVPDPEARAAYVKVLEDLLNDSILPDRTDGTGAFDDMSDNTFALADVDGDGREELILLIRPNIYAGYQGYILDHHDGALVIQHRGFPSFTFYSNGAFTEDDSHAQAVWSSDFWPHSLYTYQPGTDSYELAGHVSAWEKQVSDINEGNLPPFPVEKDTSGAGILYYIHPISSYEYLNTLDSRIDMAVDQSVYLEWLAPILGDARPLELEHLPLTEENIARIR